MNNRTVLDALNAMEVTLKECDPSNGRWPSRAAFRITTVWKYSLMYLVYTQKLDLSAPESNWIEYRYKYQIKDHYAVANAYLKKNGMQLLDFNSSVFHTKIN